MNLKKDSKFKSLEILVLLMANVKNKKVVIIGEGT